MKKGFTLVELIVVLVVLAIGLMTLLLAIRVANIQNATSHFIAVSEQLAGQKMEEVLWYRDSAGINSIKSAAFPPEDPITVSSPAFSNYKREVEIINVRLSDLNASVGGTTTGYIRVKVTVSSKAGIAPDVEVITIISDAAVTHAQVFLGS